MIIAGLDIESLSLEPDAVVFEIGIAKFDTSTLDLTSHLILPDISQQVASGRRIDQETIDWHVNTIHNGDHAAFAARLAQAWRDDGLHLQVSKAHRVIKDYLKDADEIWINGLSFDPVVISSLFSPYYQGRESIPWVYTKESDVRTARRPLKLPGFPSITLPESLEVDESMKHHARVDAIWNVAQAYQYNFGLQELLDIKARAIPA